jgi:simple sugar transport system permease protein
MNRIKDFIRVAGWSRIMIGMFLVVLFIAAPFAGVSLDFSFSDTINRFGMNAVIVLSLVFMIQSGCGLNFGVPLGLICGVFGATCSLEYHMIGLVGILFAMSIGIITAVVIGFIYGKLLNRVKGEEMIISTYVGYSFVALMNILWTVMPFKNPVIIWGYGGSGVRGTVSVEGYWLSQFSKILSIKIGPNFVFPTGMILFFVFACFCVWAFFKTKTGTAMTAVGSNPDYARASGIDVDKLRVLSVVLSTAVAAVGIIIYEQSFGFIQYYNAPTNLTFQTVAAILIGGASINKASMKNVLIGTFLFQGIVTMAPSVINSALNMDVAEVLRLIISNGMILYALTRKER